MKKIVPVFNCINCNQKSIAIPYIKKVIVINENEESENAELYLSAIKCEKCEKEFIVQIDNDYTHGLLKKQLKCNHEIGTKRIKYGASSKKIKKIENKKIKKIENKLKAVSRNLINEREMLKKLYEGKEYKEENEEIKTLIYHDFVIQLENAEE